MLPAVALFLALSSTAHAQRSIDAVVAPPVIVGPSFGTSPVFTTGSGSFVSREFLSGMELESRNQMFDAQGSLWKRWNDLWTLRKAEAALKEGRYEEARPLLAAAAASPRADVAARAKTLTTMHAPAAAGEALAKLVRAAHSRDLYAREAALDQAAFWSSGGAVDQVAAARHIWDAYSKPTTLPIGSPRTAAEVLRDLEQAASRQQDRAAYQGYIEAVRAGLLGLPKDRREAAVRALELIAERWNEAAAAALSLSYTRSDRQVAARDLADAVWSGSEAARVQAMAKELAHWTR